MSESEVVTFETALNSSKTLEFLCHDVFDHCRYPACDFCSKQELIDKTKVLALQTQLQDSLEKLALLEHEQWSEMIQYMDKRAIHGQTTIEFTVGTWNEWLRKASLHYCDLTEEEKKSDRMFARKVLVSLGLGCVEAKS